MAVPIRAYELYIGYIKELDDKVKELVAGTGSNKADIDMQTLPTGNNFVKLGGTNRTDTYHQIKANINFPKEGKGAKNPQQTIEITNPSPETIEQIRKANVVILAGGYTDQEHLPIICATQIVKATASKKQENITLKLVCADAYKVKRTTRISETYLKERTYAETIQDILDKLATYGISSHAELDELQDKQLGKARMFTNTIFQALEEILEPINYKFFMAAGILYVEPKNKSVEKGLTNVIDINLHNIKDSIEEIKATSNKNLAETKQDGNGVRVKVNLNGDMSTGDGVRINIKDENYSQHNGVYLVTSVKHVMDYEGGAWDTIIECKR